MKKYFKNKPDIEIKRNADGGKIVEYEAKKVIRPHDSVGYVSFPKELIGEYAHVIVIKEKK